MRISGEHARGTRKDHRWRPVIVAVGDVDVRGQLRAGGYIREWNRLLRQEHRPPSAGPVVRGGFGPDRGAREAAICVRDGLSRTGQARYRSRCRRSMGRRGRGLGGRMFEALRDRRSLAYTVMCNELQRAASGRAAHLHRTSPRGRTRRGRRCWRSSRASLRSRSNQAELEQAVNYLAGQAEVGRQSAAVLQGKFWRPGSSEMASKTWRICRCVRAVNKDDV